jgi:tetratricopeptide (TPR) repeat protein
MLVEGIDPFSFVSDPHQFKPIEIPFYRSGVIDGQVGILRDSLFAGQSGLRLYLQGVDRDYAETIRSFQGGGFYAMDVPPGRYTLQVDPAQLEFLDVEPRDSLLQFTVLSKADGHYLEGLQMMLVPRQRTPIEAPVPDMTLLAGLIGDIQEAKTMYLKAQEELFRGNFPAARNAIDRSLRLFESDYGIALKGSIEYMLGNRTEAMRIWNQARERNPGISLPDTKVLDYILQSNRILLPR